MEISDAVGIRIREDNKGNNKEDMDSKNLFFLKFMLRFTHRRYIMIASHKLKRYQGKGIKIPLRTAAASFYISWPGAYPGRVHIPLSDPETQVTFYILMSVAIKR